MKYQRKLERVLSVMVMVSMVFGMFATPAYSAKAVVKAQDIEPVTEMDPTAVPTEFVEPTAVPEEPTAIPEEPTMVPEEPTAIPEEPTLAPEEPTLIPEEPTLPPLDPTLPTEEPTLEPTFTPTATETESATPTVTETVTVTPTPSISPTPTITETPTLTPTETPKFKWDLVMNLVTEQAEVIQSDASFAQNLSSMGVTSAVSGSTLKMSGEENMDQLRNAIFSGLGTGGDFLGGPVEVNITLPLIQDAIYTFRFEPRPTTGYSWTVKPGEGYSQEGKPELSDDKSHTIQTISIKSHTTGPATVKMAYSRSFEPDNPLHVILNIVLPATEPFIDLSNPSPIIANTTPNQESPEEEIASDLPIAAGIPPSWDWRTQGVIPDVRNQGGCGSCWAFGTVGIMESAIRIAGGGTPDLSEQFLVSCNNNGGSCNGGYISHEYHTNTLARNQSQIGAVLESDMGYSGTNGTCRLVSNHPYRLSSYASIASPWYVIPTPAQIKSAIYTHGPITANICAGDNFQNYDGGILSASDACLSDNRHIVILVGWNDADQTWILRNSWGSWWGDNGYAYIKWGTSSIGYNATWVNFQDSGSLPVAPTLSAPTNGLVTNSKTPTLSWNAVENGSTYEVQVSQSNTFASSAVDVVTAAGTTTYTLTSPLSVDGIWYWRIRAFDGRNREGAWSTPWSFTVDTTPPVSPVLSTPANEDTPVGIPTFTWAASVSATAYQFQMATDAAFSANLFTTPGDTVPGTPLTTLSYKPASMTYGTVYYWRVRARDAAGNWGSYSSARTVNPQVSVPAAPVVSGPANGSLVNQSKLVFSWNSVSTAVKYQLQFSKYATFPLPVDIDGTVTGGLTYTPNITFPDALYYWRARAWNATGGAGPWTAALSFTLDGTPPAAPTLSTPADNASNIRSIPAFTWVASAGANAYQFQLDDNSDFSSPIITTPDGSGFPGTPLAAVSYTPASLNVLTTYYWHVKARDAAGNWGAWSTPARVIRVLPVVPPAPVLTTPVTGTLTKNTMPVFKWNSVNGAVDYHLQIDTLSTFASPDLEASSTSGATTFTPPVSITPDALYYWRVQAVNANGEAGAWSTPFTFNLDTTPPLAPALSVPADNAPNIRAIPTFSWLASVGATAYQFQIDDNADFSSTIVTTPDGAGTSGTPLAVVSYKPGSLDLLTDYYWRVRARDAAGNWGDWSLSPVRTIRILPIIPVAPVLSSPATGYLTNNTTPTFTWKAAVAGVDYHLQIDNQATFASPEVDAPTTGGLLTFTPSSGITPDAVYYWRVQAINANAEPGAWSTPLAFTLDTTPPLPPALSVPANNAPNIRAVPTFSWLASVGATAYQFQIDDNADFSSTIVTTPDGAGIPGTPLTVVSYKPASLDLLVDYYWRVRARDAAGNWGDWSLAPVRTIRVLPVIPVAPVLKSPASGFLTNNTTPAFTWNAVASGIDYHLQIDNQATFASPEVDAPTTGGLLTFTPSTGITPDAVYYWRVQAINANAEPGAWSTPLAFTLDTTPPLPPALSVPADKAANIRAVPTFSWLASVGATAYQLQIDDNDDFSSPVVNTPDGSSVPGTPLAVVSYKPASLDLLTDYYWRVRARDAAGNWGDWSLAPVRTIRVLPVIPVAPVLSSPATGYLTNNTTPTFTWKAAVAGMDYHLQIDNQATFASPEVDAPTTGGLLTFTPSTGITPDAVYYWRVQAINANAEPGAWSTPLAFTLDTTPPLAPALSVPADKAANIRAVPTFSWLASVGATAYQLQIDNDSDFSSPVVNTPDGSSVPGNPLAVVSYKPASLDLLTDYYWRVRARDAAGNWAEWSKSPVRTIRVLPVIPVAPVLKSPASGFLTNNTTPAFTWNAVASGIDYHLQIDNQATFASPEVDAPTTGGLLTFTPSSGITPDAVYYWRVQAINANAEPGAWSTPLAFTLDTKPPLPPALSVPANNAPNIRGIPVFSWAASVGATAYQFQIDDNVDFSSPETTPDGAGTPGTPLAVVSYKPASLNMLTDYYWRVRARDAAGNWGEWSLSPVRTIRVLPVIPVAPVLKSPTAGFLTNNSTPVFTWNAVAAGVDYHLQIDNQATFASPEVDAPTTGGLLTFTPSAGITPDTVYYWRVQAINANAEFGAWSTPFAFTLDTTPPLPPAQSAPANEAAGIRAIPTFTWLPSVGATAYQFQMSPDPLFNVDVITTPGDTVSGVPLAVTSYRPASMNMLTKYFWHVRARDAAGNWGLWSSTVTRSVIVLPVIPAAPVLTAPVSGSLTNNTTPTFKWNTVTAGVDYQIQVDNLATFASPEINETTTAGNLTFTPSTGLSPDGVYYWRVRAINASNETGAWSTASAFTLDTTPPAAPVYSTPVDNAANIRVIPAFTWVGSVGANAYQYQIDDTNDFSSPVFTTPDGSIYPGTPLAVTSYTPSSLTVLTTYYWRVRARDAAGNWADWSKSQVRTIRILPAIPVAPVLKSPTSGFLTNNTTPTFTWNSVSSGIDYHLQIDNLATFASPEVDSPTTGGLTTFTPLTGISPDAVYYWRVQAVNANAEPGAWSAPLAFTLDATPPPAPVLSSPADTATPVGIPTFSWGVSVGANAYQFQMATDSGFTANVFTTPGDTVPGTILAAAAYKPTSMVYGTVYYWHVRARDAAGNWGSWSATHTVNPQAAVPVAPVLTSPASGYLTNAFVLMFAWNGVASGSTYQIQVDNLSTFASPELDVHDDSGLLTYTSSPIGPDGLYYWRVRAWNSTGGAGAWSVVRSFTIDTTPPSTAPVLTSPANNAIVTAMPTFTWTATGATAYKFQLDDNSDFSSLLVTTPGDPLPGTPITTAYYKPTVTLEYNVTYYWRVHSYDAALNNSAYSTPRSFKLLPPLTQDSDGDSLPDYWEYVGYDANKDGIIDVDLPALGADPFHKDIFVEMDYMVTPGGVDLGPDASMIGDIEDVFNNAPVSNPDGTTGIHIHLEKDDQLPFVSDMTNPFVVLDSIKQFDTARIATHHYMVWANGIYGDTTSGVSRGIGASQFIVALGKWGPEGGTYYERMGTFIHELGHNLGLTHGGTDHENFKPNYLSVMNYFYQTSGLYINTHWGFDGYPLNFDYQRIDTPPLNENSLNESTGLSGAGDISSYGVEYYVQVGEYYYDVYSNKSAQIDWNDDGDKTDTGVRSDINQSGTYSVLTSQNNWQHLTFKGGGVIGSGNSLGTLIQMSQSTPPIPRCLTLEMEQEVESIRQQHKHQ